MDRLIEIVRNKLFLIAAAILVIYTLAGFFLVPRLVRHYVPVIAHNQLNKQATIGKVRVNPFVFTIEANDFALREPDAAPVAAFKRLFVDFELHSLFKWAWTFRQVSLDGPSVQAVIDADGGLNLARLVPPSPPGQMPVQDQGQARTPRLIFEEIQLNRGRFDLGDQRQSPPAAVILEPLDLKVRHLTTFPGKMGETILTATGSDGATLLWNGTIGLNPLTLKGTVALEHLQTATLWAFAQNALTIEKPTGQIAITSDCVADLSGPAARITLDNLSVALTDFGLQQQGSRTPLLALPGVHIDGGRLDLAERLAQVGTLSIAGGQAALSMAADGTLNWRRIVKEARAATPAANASAPESEPLKPWRITLAAFDCSGFAVDFTDTRREPGIGAGIGALKVGLKAEAQFGDTAQVRVEDIGVEVSGLRLKALPAAEPLLRLDTIRIGGGDFDLTANRLAVAKVAVEGGGIDIRRQADGSLNLAGLFARSQKEAAREAQNTSPAQATAENRPLRVSLKSVGLSGLQADFTDLTVGSGQPLIHLEDVRLAVSDVDGQSPMPFELDIRIRQGGQIETSGTIDPSRPSVTSQVRVSELALPLVQPYIEKAVAVVLTSGTFFTQGTFQHDSAAAGARTAYQGEFALDALRVDRAGSDETLFGCKSLRAEQLTLNLTPNKMEIGQVRLVQPTGKIVIEKDKTLNLANVVKPDAEPKPQKRPGPSEPGAEMPYSVKRVMISEGRVDFADLNLPMPFGTKIHELKGNVVGISSTKDARAQVKFDGRVDDFGTAKVEGELNTADPRAFMDIGVIFKNVEMANLTPYSGKFAGRKIDSGKLSVDLQYKIDNRQLAGENQIVVDRLTLGEKVESPDAVNLPLDLALALLKDADGVIELGLPVRGNLDAPEFSIGAIIGKAIVNLLTKIVTSPFRALAALIPGASEEKFKAIAFEPGSADIPPPEKEKLAKLATAMQQRPQLKLMVQGAYNADTDGARLRADAVRRKLAERLAENKKRTPNEEDVPVDFSSPQTGRAIEDLFAERFGADALKSLKDSLKATEDKPSQAGETAPAKDPGLLAKQLFNGLVEGETLDDAALVQLADRRAQTVIADLKGPLALPAERLGTKPAAASSKSAPGSATLALEALPAKSP